MILKHSALVALSRECSRRVVLSCLLVLLIAQAKLVQQSLAQPANTERPAPDADAPMISLSLLRHDASALSQGEVSSVQLSGSSATQGLHVSLWGAWGRVTLSNQSWTTAHDELRLHPQLNLATRVGRASLALTAGAGLALIHELRSRHQAERLGLNGAGAETSALRWGPELSAGASISLPLSDYVGLQLSSVALLRPIGFSKEAPTFTYAQSLGLSWSFK